MRPTCPKVCDRRADRGIGVVGVGIDVLRIGNLALGGGVDAVDFGAGEGAQVGEAVLVGEGVDAGVLEELLAALVHFRDGGVGFEDARAGYFFGEVFAGVEELEEAADGVDVFFVQLDLAWLSIVEILAFQLSQASTT